MGCRLGQIFSTTFLFAPNRAGAIDSGQKLAGERLDTMGIANMAERGAFDVLEQP
jgi:hypothetical protein